MNYRAFGTTGWKVSEIGLGTWAMGGTIWGATDDATSLAALHEAVDRGVNLFDTADVYGDGHAERLVGKLRAERDEELIIATKAGRRLKPHVAEGYNRENLTAFVERSLTNLGVEAIDLLQLHCPPSPVFRDDEVYGVLDDLVTAGKLRFYGVSVEKVSEALDAIARPNVQSVQIIFNAFRLKPAEELFAAAQKRQVAILARVPLASGMLTGKFSAKTTFADNDHRQFNRAGKMFDRGETFSGVDFERGLEAVAELRELAGETPLAQFALRWILMHDAITTVIPGAKTPAQARSNAEASELAALDESTMARVKAIYDEYLRADIHPHW